MGLGWKCCLRLERSCCSEAQQLAQPGVGSGHLVPHLQLEKLRGKMLWARKGRAVKGQRVLLWQAGRVLVAVSVQPAQGTWDQQLLEVLSLLNLL